ncbi:hypothetical protein FRC03_007928 [Tulasnella sp. 419]|nr:hypothetical protein FRC03_007928 [Tulasnella sp. 419]
MTLFALALSLTQVSNAALLPRQSGAVCALLECPETYPPDWQFTGSAGPPIGGRYSCAYYRRSDFKTIICQYWETTGELTDPNRTECPPSACAQAAKRVKKRANKNVKS